ncbi:MAG: hypothetical protein J1E98_15245 [Lachnospiraceae bacterium]|nr:hypothetical protein [Lachnospiraceae bacterium]
MSYQRIRNTREGFVDMSAGDGLIKMESWLIGVVVFFYMLIGADAGFISSLIAGLLLVILVPWIVGLLPAVAMIFAICFSVAWAILVYFIAGALLGVPAGVICALIVLIISFYLHKIFGGLGYSSLTKIHMDSVRQTSANTAKTNQILSEAVSNASEQVSNKAEYCPFCGTKLNGTEKFCGSCGAQL